MIYSVPYFRLAFSIQECRNVNASSASEAAGNLVRSIPSAVVNGYPSVVSDMDIVLDCVQQIGYDAINPESLSDLQDRINDGDYFEARGPFRRVMQGFRELLAPAI